MMNIQVEYSKYCNGAHKKVRNCHLIVGPGKKMYVNSPGKSTLERFETNRDFSSLSGIFEGENGMRIFVKETNSYASYEFHIRFTNENEAKMTEILMSSMLGISIVDRSKEQTNKIEKEKKRLQDEQRLRQLDADIGSCLMDPTFPAFVKSIKKGLQRVQKKCGGLISNSQ